ncbi:MAG: MgtC/SapB family protein [Candidatus Gastranaerophilales bacterium]|nr:MgtC/SapB family protein [Candidatus Gastranaerophilales bacterium]
MHEIHSYLLGYTMPDMLIRLCVSAILGFAIGFEREYTSKWAGIKTHMLVALGSTVFTILSIYSFPKIAVTGAVMCVGDPSRVAAQILTGIGFIGGGTVLRHGVSVYGLTTAASLWIAASIGMAAGTGDFDIAVSATVISVIVLVAFRKFQNEFIKPKIKTHVPVKVSLITKEENAQNIIDHITHNFEHILELKKNKYHHEEEACRIIAKIDIIDKDPVKKVYKMFNKIDSIESLSIEQDLHE